MSASAGALLGYIAWTLLLIIVMEVYRTALVVSGRKAADSFRPDGTDVSPFAHRLARAHANCYESFPLIGGLLLLAVASGSTSVTDPLAWWALVARVLQSSIHLLSTNALMVRIRFILFAVQLAIALWWIVEFLRAAAG
jgi:hypothetical protein